MGRNNMYELGGVGCHGYLEIVFDEVLNIEMMENAWNKVIQKHDMLRAIVFDVGYQIVQESVPYVHIPCIDLRNDKEHSEEKKKAGWEFIKFMLDGKLTTISKKK